MSSQAVAKTGPVGTESNCLVQTVAEAMKNEPALEAVRFDRARRSVSVATLGKSNNADLERNLMALVQQMELASQGERCALLDGTPDCSACPVPHGSEQRRKITIQAEPDATTISRVTCPTAPTFWRWCEFAWPRLVPRKVLLPDEADHEHEWKEQLLAAILCGVLGLTAYFGLFSRLFYALAYLAGGWFTAHEIWERLRQRTLDVHFLMLTVAVGSACIGAWGEGATLLFLFSFSGALEHYAMGRTQREIRSLFRSAPKAATLVDQQGNERSVPVEQLEPGLRLLVRPGEQFPADAEIVKGQTASDESNLTGEGA